MPNLKDYLGREIRLTHERLLHILEHPEMNGLESLIDEALKSPEMVIESLSDEKVWLFYRQLPEARVGVNWLCVVVKYQERDAFILTSYLTDRPKKGRQRWPVR